MMYRREIYYMVLPSVRTFIKDYDSIYTQAEIIFKKYNLCQWEKNNDGSSSCIVNRRNSKNKKSPFIETDGCCIYVCKIPKDFDDKLIKRKQHNVIHGCNIKSLKCKLHLCTYLRELKNTNTNLAIQQIDQLINRFKNKYDALWKSIPFGSSKKIWVEFYKMYKNKL
jgi:hypothetical protein